MSSGPLRAKSFTSAPLKSNSPPTSTPKTTPPATWATANSPSTPKGISIPASVPPRRPRQPLADRPRLHRAQRTPPPSRQYPRLQEKTPCKTCDIASRCQNKCACLNWQTLGALDNPSPILCAHEKLITPIADRIGQILWNKQAPHFIQKHYNRCYPLLSLIEDAKAASFD